jgi:hypothetical protein
MMLSWMHSEHTIEPWMMRTWTGDSDLSSRQTPQLKLMFDMSDMLASGGFVAIWLLVWLGLTVAY